jgi:hypothetical protein
MERLIQIVTTEILGDRLKAEAELERIINDATMDVDTKVTNIRIQLTKLASFNQMAAIWLTYTTPEQNVSESNPETENK